MAHVGPSKSALPAQTNASTCTPTKPPKRKRLKIKEDKDVVLTTITTKHPNVWHADGDVILEADKTHFRVHRWALTRASSFFEGIFFAVDHWHGVPVDSDGCPVLCLSGTVGEWEVMFEHLYRPHILKMKLKLSLIILWEEIASLLHLGHEYHCIAIRNNTLRCLKAQLPNIVECNRLYKHGPDSAFWCAGKELDILKVALELRLQSVLPMAYYLCIVSHKMSEFEKIRTKLDGFAAEDRQRLFDGRSNIDAVWQRHNWDWVMGDKIPCASCASAPGVCARYLRIWQDSAAFKAKELSSDVYPLDVWDLTTFSPGLCSACGTAACSAHRATLDELWKNLTCYFGLPDWEALRDFVAP